MTRLALLIVLIAPGFAPADEPVKPYETLDELRASYARQSLDLDRRRISDLTALAARKAGAEADSVYRELFALAVARELYGESEPAASAYLKLGNVDPRDQALAFFIGLIAKANRGEYESSFESLEGFLKANGISPDPSKRLDTETAIGLREAYLQRLARAGHYDLAIRVCDLAIANHPDATVRAHFTARKARLAMIGKPAPALSGRDADGKPVALSDLRGKVVLIDFWATWCPPCVAAVPELQSLTQKYGKDGFVILGVNLDARRQDVGDAKTAAGVVREFLVNARITWPNILLGPGPDDPAAAYDVDEIPASFLLDRSGKIIEVEQVGPELDKAIASALKKPG